MDTVIRIVSFAGSIDVASGSLGEPNSGYVQDTAHRAATTRILGILCPGRYYYGG